MHRYGASFYGEVKRYFDRLDVAAAAAGPPPVAGVMETTKEPSA